MGKINKTRVTYTAGLPGGGATVTLFDSTVAFGPKAMHLMAEFYWADISILCDQNATGNSFRGQYSNDGGTTWLTFFTSTVNTPTAGLQFNIEVFIGQFQDVRFQFLNGATPQTTFVVNFNLDACERSTANHSNANLDTP